VTIIKLVKGNNLMNTTLRTFAKSFLGLLNWFGCISSTKILEKDSVVIEFFEVIIVTYFRYLMQ